MALQVSPADLLAQVNRDVERSYLRARNGLRYVRGRNRPKLGTTPKDVVWRRDKAQLWRYRGGRPVRPAAADRHQPGQPQLHPRPPAREQRGRVPARPRLRRLHARLGDPGRAGRRQQPRDLRGRVPAARRGGGAPRDRLRGDHDRRLLPRRRALRPLRQRSRGRGRAQPRADGDAGRLRGDGPDGGRAARGQARPRAPHRRDRQRAGRRALQRLLHARPDDDRGPAGDAAREPLERRVRARLPGDGAVGPRPGALPRARCSARSSSCSSAATR